ncbi:MAG: hypothetical protein JEY99_08685 [Spirochaetales bacterium]|nr:hypothetical protein [Spirochaetales bacterium]
MKNYFLFVFFLLLPVFSSFSEERYFEITSALGLAYNFEFEKAEEILLRYRTGHPDSVEAELGIIVYDFLLINQNPSRENFNRIYDQLETLEERVTDYLKVYDDYIFRFYDCFINYYYMKSYALDGKWIRMAVHAARARELAVTLKTKINELPDLYFILGDQDYSTSLVPDYLSHFLRALKFSPDRYQGLSYIKEAVELGEFTRNEAALFCISTSIYVEKEYDEALERSYEFLEEFPDNLSVGFYLVDLLLRLGEIEAAEERFLLMEARVASGALGRKWIPRAIQMRGNLNNAMGDYGRAIEFYLEALGHRELSQYSVTEITLEMGKLYDIMGDRSAAQSAYRDCMKSGGLELMKDEAKLLRREAYEGGRGSY